MRLTGVIVGLGVAACGAVIVSSTAVAAPNGFRKGPYLQNVTQGSVTIMWQPERKAPGIVRLLDGSQHGDLADRVIRVIESEATRVHEVVVDKLEVGRRYRYEVESLGQIRQGEFATAPESGVPFSFVVFGDSRSNAGSHRRVVERVRREVPDFILGTGDMVDQGARDDLWQRFFDIEGALLRENVMFPSLGNHDRQGRGRTADNFRRFFSLPENSPNPERYYAFTYSNARFLVLDSNSYAFALTDQTAWIEQQLQQARLDPKVEFIFVSMHHPPFSISLHGGRTELRNAWGPLFEKYGVTAVFSGHDHCYSRAQRNGVHYFVSGGGGAPLYPRSRKPSSIDTKATRYFERTNHFLRVVIMGHLVEVSAIRADGSLMESVSWGTAPRPAEALAGLRLGSAAGSGEALAAPPQEASPGRIQEVAAASSTSGLGALGFAGGALALLGALSLLYSLRRAAAQPTDGA